MYSYGPPHMAEQKQDDQLENTYSSSVRIRDVALKTCQRRWTIGRSGERGSGISVLTARHDDDDYIVIHSHTHKIYPFRLRLTKTDTFLAWIFTFSLTNIFVSYKEKLRKFNFPAKVSLSLKKKQLLICRLVFYSNIYTLVHYTKGVPLLHIQSGISSLNVKNR